MNKKANANDNFKNYLPYIILIGVIALVFTILNFQGNKVNELTTGELIKELKEDKVTEVEVTPKSNESIYYITGKLDGYKKNETFTAKVIASELDNILILIENNENITSYKTESDPGESMFLYIVVNVLPIVIIVIAMYFLISRMANVNKGSMDFARSKARLSDEHDKKNFKDVAGLKE